MEEEEVIKCTATQARPVSTGISSYGSYSRIVGDWYLHTGKPVDTVLGLDVLMNTSSCQSHQLYHQLLEKKEKGIEEEVRQHGDQMVLKVLNYILYEEASDGIHDKKRETVNLDYFVKHSNAQKAQLTREEVVALRLYTTLAYSHINDHLRDKERQKQNKMCPLSATTLFAYKAAKKLRALNSGICKDDEMVLWRGMRQLKVTDDFQANGGTELGFMSATRLLDVAVRYSLSRHEEVQNVLLFKIRVPTFVSSGAELGWVSAFPHEGEMLFPPLTFLEPTGREDRLTVERGSMRVYITVVEVVPHVG
jgi:hypothetical protein